MLETERERCRRRIPNPVVALKLARFRDVAEVRPDVVDSCMTHEASVLKTLLANVSTGMRTGACHDDKMCNAMDREVDEWVMCRHGTALIGCGPRCGRRMPHSGCRPL